MRARSLLAKALSSLLVNRSVMRRWQYPSRLNSIHSFAVLILSLPLTVLMLPFFAVRRIRHSPIDAYVLATDGEFAHFVELMEALRDRSLDDSNYKIILVLSKWKHRGFSKLYSSRFGWRILWTTSFARFMQQALLLLPRCCVRATWLTRKSNHGARRVLDSPLDVSRELLNLRQDILRREGMKRSKYVTMAVYTLQYEVARNPEYLWKTQVLESDGVSLVPAVRYLLDRQVDVVLLGSADQGRAKMNIDIPRLEDFAKLGGAEEIALASGCEYFWTDGPGAWWLTFPFNRPVLFSNQYHLPQGIGSWPHNHLVVPLTYKTPDNHELTLREIFSHRTNLSKLVARGELVAVRNTAEEIVAAHMEMLVVKNGNGQEDDLIRSRKEQVARILNSFPEFHQISIANSYLEHHPGFLD